MEAMIERVLAQIEKKHRLLGVGKSTSGREARTVDTSLYSVSITTDAEQARLVWNLKLDAIRERAKEIGTPDVVGRMISKIFGASPDGETANWLFCVMIDETPFHLADTDTFASVKGRARASSKISDEISLSLNPSRPDMAEFFVMFDHDRRFVIDEDMTVMLQHEPAPGFDDVSALKEQFEAISKQVWGKEADAAPSLSEQEKMLNTIVGAFETKAALKARLQALGYAGDELDEALENAQYYIHQMLKQSLSAKS